MIAENTDAPASTASDGLTEALVLHTGGAVKLIIDADELDIGLAALNQSASVTLDAYPGKVFAASVTHISRIGAVGGSITTYPIEVTLGFDARLLVGMNGSAVILTAKKENVPLLPVNRINEDFSGTYVAVLAANGAYERRDITTGLSDGIYAEITSGLVAGDQIWYLDTSSVNVFTAMMDQRSAAENESGYSSPGGN
jgi:multidrug efflux pump subunit AcrA (membrane-fusion protein)